MYVAKVPNRKSPPAILLRESYRQDGKVKSRTLANLTHLPSQQIEALRSALAGTATAPSAPLPDAFRISRSFPHGHVAAVLGCLRNLELDSILDPAPGRQRDLVIAMIVARIIEPASKLATARGLHCDTLHHSLGEILHLDSADETELYQAMDWLVPQQSRIEQALAKRQLSQGGFPLTSKAATVRWLSSVTRGTTSPANCRSSLACLPMLPDARSLSKYLPATPPTPRPSPPKSISYANNSVSPIWC